MAVDPSLIKKLREKTGAGILDCRKALDETNGDMDRAVIWLREKGLAAAKNKAGRETREGLVSAYIHPGGKMGVLLEVNCETDFVARTDDFAQLVKDVAMHIVASDPSCVSRESVPEEGVKAERAVYLAQARESGKPEAVWDKIATGRLEKFFQETCLLEQSFVKDPTMTVEVLIKEKIAKLGENISIRRFTRYRLVEE